VLPKSALFAVQQSGTLYVMQVAYRSDPEYRSPTMGWLIWVLKPDDKEKSRKSKACIASICTDVADAALKQKKNK